MLQSIVLPALVALAGMACRDRVDSKPVPKIVSDASVGSAVQAGRRAGRSGEGGVRAALPRPPAPQPETGLTCSDKPCVSPHDAIFPCCLPDGSCGAGINGECRALEQPGTADSACASHRAQNASLELAGCCKPDGRCGVFVDYGLGCVERSELPVYLEGPLAATACGTASGTDDGGT
jgi:hypothetical protein